MFSMYRDVMDTCGQEGVMDGETQQQLRLRIYEATIEEFREKGFKFTMDDMARWCEQEDNISGCERQGNIVL